MKNCYAEQVDSIAAIIQETIPNAKLKSDNGNLLTFLLPNENKSLFHHILLDLENKKEQLGIQSISISVTTLEEVFLRYIQSVNRVFRKLHKFFSFAELEPWQIAIIRNMQQE